MKIKVISTSQERIKEGQKDYVKLTVTYVDVETNKVNVKTLVSFGAGKLVFDRLKDAQSNEIFEVGITKDGKYSNWTEVARFDGVVPETTATLKESGSSAPAPAKKGAWVDDAVRQRLIVRQSSLASAINYFGTEEASVAEVLDVAEQFTNFVFEAGVAFIKDDQPE